MKPENNPVINLREKLRGEWGQNKVSEVYPNYEQFFEPGKKGEVEINKPEIMSFYDVAFFSRDQEVSTYDGVIFRIEEGTGLDEVSMKVREKSYAPSRYFRFRNVEDILNKAKESGFEIDEKKPTQIELSTPSEVAEGIVNFFEEIMNTVVANEFWPFILALSYGTTEGYAKACHDQFDEELIFEKLEFLREPNFGLIKPGSYDTLSKRLVGLWESLTDQSDIEKVTDCLGIEPVPAPRGELENKNYQSYQESIDEGKFGRTEEILQKIRSWKDGYPYSSRNVGKIAREIGVPIGDLLRGLAPLLYLGLVTYSNGKIDFTKLRKKVE